LVASDQAGYSPNQLTNVVYASFRSHRKDRCAIFANADEIGPLLRTSRLDASPLEPRENARWTGTPVGLRRRWKRTVIGDYTDWFCWYMAWQRFNAFHLLVLVKPVSRMITDEDRGFLDGLLARLSFGSSAVFRIIVVEERRFHPLIERWLDGPTPTPAAVVRPEDHEAATAFGHDQAKQQAVLATLFGRTLSHAALKLAVGRTLSATLGTNWDRVVASMERARLIERRHTWFRRLSDDGTRAVECIRLPESAPEGPRFRERAFQYEGKREHLRVDETWLEREIETLLAERGSFTLPELYDRVRNAIHRMLASEQEAPPRFIRDFADPERDPRHPKQVALPRESDLRSAVERLVAQERLRTLRWVRETGRPVAVYYRRETPPRLDAHHACGQCALYVSLRRRCELWWTIARSIGARDPRWQKDGEHPLSPFELHRMTNSWRVGPRSSACVRFIDKKRDHTAKTPPERCEICGEHLDTPSERRRTACPNCGTAYFADGKKKRIRVATAYRHEFRRNYRELTGRDPQPDLERIKGQQADSLSVQMERIMYEAHRNETVEGPKTVVFFPGDVLTVEDGTAILPKRRRTDAIPLEKAVVIDQGGLDPAQRESLESLGVVVKTLPMTGIPQSVAAPAPTYDVRESVEKLVGEESEIVRAFAVAMDWSAAIATRRLVALQTSCPPNVLAAPMNGQIRLAEQSRFVVEQRGPLNTEAQIMKTYWKCFDWVLKLADARFGPRKKSRFVREYVTSPAARARGYSAIDAAINYLHQRRLFKCRQAGSGVGLGPYPGEGFLHRSHGRNGGIGLLLDLSDPFKFGDRERLAEAVKNTDINWRDFYVSSDRHGTNFYYPQPRAIDALETIGAQADALQVSYEGRTMPLEDAYRTVLGNLVRALREGTTDSFEPFVFGNERDARVLDV
jgi:predicted  nucleic acid-binding Zn-ribbon protein